MNKYISNSIKNNIKSDIVYSENKIYFIDKQYNICSYNIFNKELNIIDKINIKSQLIMGNLSINNNKLIALVLLYNKYFIYIINLNNGKMEYAKYLDVNLLNINIINDDTIIGINNNNLVMYNLTNNEMTILSMGYKNIILNSNILLDKYYYFTSNNKLQKYNIYDNILCDINSVSICIDNYLNKTLNKNDTIVINEVQNCICIIGKKNNHVFVAHISKNSSIIPELISYFTIKHPFLNNMNFTIIGDIYNDTYSCILKFIGNKYEFNLFNHLDKKYNIIITCDEILIN